MRCARFCHPIQGSHIIFSLPEAYPRLLLLRPLCGLYLALGGEQTPRSTGLSPENPGGGGQKSPDPNKICILPCRLDVAFAGCGVIKVYAHFF